MPKPIYDAIKELLVERGWKIDPDAKETRSGILREFIHPEDGHTYAYIDAVLEEGLLELYRERKNKS